ncbi:hypothetical protein PBRA_009291 [Plasmodiophora brassicae]|nr:hypothetical protein PBRA_009291 [Plasmodiophora brassicae]
MTTSSSSSSRQFSEKGRQFQKGRFTPGEKEILRKAVLDYVREHDLGDAGIQMLCAKKRRPELRGAWSIIAQCLPHRSVSSCYHFCTRAFADRSTGKWTDDDIALLRQLVAKHGRKWTLIGSMIERLPCSCRDKYRLLEKRGSKWTLDEEELLVQHMRAYGDTVPLELPRHDPSSCLEHWRVKFAGYIVDGEGVACAADQKLLRGVIQQQADTFHAIQWSCIDVPDWPASFRAWRWEVLAGTVKSYCTFITGPVEISKMVLQHIASQSLPLSPPGQHRQVVAAPGQLLHQAPIVALQQHPQAFAQQHPQPQRQNQEHQQQYVNNDLFAGEEGSVGLVDLQGL